MRRSFLKSLFSGNRNLLILLVFFALAVSLTSPAYAVGFVVSKTADTNDGTCDADCSLREAVAVANGSARADTINLSVTALVVIEPTLMVEFNNSSSGKVEGNSGTSAQTSLALSVKGGVSTTPRTIDVALTDGSATLADNDYSQTNLTITIAAGDYTSAQGISIPVAALGIVGDTKVEPDETFTVTIQNPSADLILGDANGNSSTVSSATFHIFNDDGANYIVDTTSDTSLTACTPAANDCSLRGAIINANGDGVDKAITFDSSVFNPGTITLTSNLPNITANLSITGNGTDKVIVNGNNAYRSLFRIATDGLNVTVSNLQAVNGFVAGTGFGGALDLDSAGGTLTLNNVLLTNGTAGYGGGINADGGTLAVNNSIIRNGTANTSSGGIWSGPAVTVNVMNSLFTGNSGKGGALFNNGGILKIYNSTIAGNTSSNVYAAGVHNNGGTLVLYNSLLADNIGSDGDCRSISSNDIQNTLIKDGSCGITDGTAGNLIADPALNADFTISTSSPAINAGDNSLLPGGVTTDLAGNARIQQTTVDMGAYESPYTPALPVVTITPAAFSVNEGSNADFTITRTGSTTSALVVTVNITLGTGTVAADYTLSGGSISAQSGSGVTVTIPAGSASVNVNLVATDDVDAEADNTLTLALVDGAAYDLGTDTSSTATIPANDFVVTNTNDSGDGSLRQAITNANAFNTNDTITFTAGVNGTITLASLLPNIANNGKLTITGNGVTNTIISGNHAVRVFTVPSGATASLSDLTVTNGSISGDVGGGIYNGGSLTLTNVTVSNNTSDQGGGGLSNNGPLTVTNSTFSGNQGNIGGGISTGSGTVIVTNSTFSGNSGANGGGIYASGGTVTVTNSTFSSNTVTTSGGGITSQGSTLIVINSTFSGNSGGSFGGGNILNWSTLTITNSTLSGGTASSGGGIRNQQGTTTLNNSIIANSASGGDCSIQAGTVTAHYSLIMDGSCGVSDGDANHNKTGNPQLGSLIGSPAYYPLQSSSFAIDAGSDALIPGGVTTDQGGNNRIQGTAVDMGAYESAFTATPDVTISPAAFNVNEGANANFTITRTGSTTSALTVTVNITQGTGTVAADYTLSGGSISAQSGSGVTVTIPAGSASVNVNLAATDDVDAEADNTLTLDLVDGAAYNLGATTSSTATIPANDFVVTNTNASGDGSLRQAITNANNIAGTDTITFDATVFNPATITLSSDLPNITTDMNVTGLGATKVIVDGASLYRPFNILSGTTVSISGLTIAHGNSTGGLRSGGITNAGALTVSSTTFSANTTNNDGGGIRNSGTLTVSGSTFSANTVPGGVGGGIYNAGTATVNSSTFDHNTSGNGSGIYSASGTLTVTSSTFDTNSALSGGNGGGISIVTGTATVSSSTFSNNSASNSGGGIVDISTGALTVTSSIFDTNSATANGGGIYVNGGGTVTVSSSTFDTNSADFGGGIASGDTLTVVSSTFSANIASSNGGGLYNGGPLTLINSTFSGNSAPTGGGLDNASTATVSDSTLSSNSATSGGNVGNESGTLNLNNSIVANSTGGGDCQRNGGTINAHFSLIEGGLGCINGTNTNNLTGGPALNSDLTLSNTSIAINTGDNSLIPGGVTTDLAGNARIQNTTVDMGAYESAFTPFVPNVTISPATFNVNEGSNANFMITRTGSTTSALTVTVNITQGTDTSAADYTLTGGSISAQSGSGVTVTIPAGSASVNVNFAATDDVDAEANNTLSLALVDQAAYNLGATTSSTATIPENDFVVTNTNDSGDGSLRQAITNANAFASDDTITFTASANGTITLATALPHLANNGSLTITGNGAANTIISGNNAVVVFYADQNSVVTLNKLTVTNGSALLGGAIFPYLATLSINNSAILNSHASQWGGAIYNQGGTLAITNTIFSGNSAVISGGVVFNAGGTLTINNSTFSANSAGTAGAILNSGTLTITNSILANNSPDDCGISGTIKSTLVETGGSCGIIDGVNGNLTGDPALTNDLTDLTLTSSSIAINAGDNNLIPGGITTDLAGNARIQNTTVDMGAYESPFTPFVPDVTISPAAFNVAEGSNTDFTLTRTGNTLSALAVTLNLTQGTGLVAADYTLSGGSVSGQTGSVTVTIPAGSSSVNLNFAATDDVDAEADNVLTLDLIDGAAYDIAVSSSRTATIPANDFVVTNTNDSGDGSLRQAITNANAFNTNDAITFTAGANGTITLASTLPNLANNGTLTITGSGAANTIVSGNDAVRVFVVEAGADVTLDSVAVTHGNIAGNGGGVLNNGTLSVTNSTFSNNQGNAGGGIASISGTLTVTSSIFSSNSTTGTGGAIENLGTATVTDSTFSNNIAVGGGALDNVGTLDITSSTLENNTASYEGGAIDNYGGTLTIINSVISGNAANGATSVDGGGALDTDNGGTVLIINSTIVNNAAVQTSHSGLFVEGGTLTLQNSIVANNSGGDCSGTVTAQNSLIKDGSCAVSNGVNGNLTGDPALNGDLTLSSSSIAINAGDNSLIPGGITTDLAGNARIQQTTVDMGAYESTFSPGVLTVALSSTATDPTKVSPISVTATFSQTVTGFIATDITVGNGSVGNFAGSGSIYTFDVTPSAQGLVTVDIAANVAQFGAAGNTAATQLTRTYDSIAPTVLLSTTTTDPTNTAPIPITATFSEAITGFIAADITVGNGTVSNFTGDGTTFTFDITPSVIAGTITVDIAANKAQDAAGNNNSAAIQLSIVFESVPPNVNLSSSASNFTNVSPIPFEIIFSEAVTGFIDADVTVTNGTISNFVAVTASDYTFTVTPSAQGGVSIHVDAAKAQDLAGNDNLASSTLNRTYDSIAPSILLSSTTIGPTNTSPIPMKATFSETVTGFTEADITIGNGTVGNFAGSGAIYTFDVTPAGAGLVTVDIAANVAQDTAGNGNTAASQFSITYDNVAPTVIISSSASDPTNTAPIPVTATFSEAVTGLIDTDFTVGNGTVSNFTGSGTTYIFDVTPGGLGLVTVDLAANSTQDAAGNGNTAAPQFAITYGNPTPLVTISPAIFNVNEGSNANFTITRTGSTASSLVVMVNITQGTGTVGTDYTLSGGAISAQSGSGVTMTIPAGSASVDVNLTAVDDSSDETDEMLTLALVDGAVYDLGTDTSGMATILDNDAAGITVSPTNGLTTTEAGGTATFTIVLNTQPTDDVTIGLSSSDTSEGTIDKSSLTFTNANWNIAQMVTVTGVNDALVDGNVAYSIVTAAAISVADANYNGLDAADVSVSNGDNDSAGITVNLTSGLTTTETGGTATFTVVLNTQPSDDVTLGLSSSDTSEGTIDKSSLTFTSVNWNVAQTVTVTGVDDALVDGGVAYTIVTAAATSAADANYNGFDAVDVSVTNNDNDSAGITISPTNGLVTTEAGGTTTFTVVLNTQPIDDIVIGLSSSDTSEGTIDKSSLTFTSVNWNIAQMVTVMGVDDALVDGNVAYTILTAAATSVGDANYNSLDPTDVSVSNSDDDSASITVNLTSGLVTTEAGGTATFTVVLNTQPSADVTIGLSSSDTSEGTIDKSSFTFTSVDWNVAQTVTVTGADDLAVDGSVAYTIITDAATSSDANYNGLDAADVSVSNSDDDSAGITISPTSGLVTTEAGGMATFTVVLNTQPTADVTEGLSSSDTSEGTIDKSSLTFTTLNWNIAQTVTITGVDDALVDGNVPYTILTGAATSGDTNYNSLDATDVSVSNSDDDSAGITVSSTSGLTTTEAGGTATFTVVLNTQPSADVTIGLGSSNTAEGTVSPTSLTFTSLNWNVAQTVSVTGVDDFIVDGDVAYSVVTTAVSSSDANYSGLDPADVSVTNTDNDSAGISISPTILSMTENGPSQTYSISVVTQPSAPFILALSFDPTQVIVNGSSTSPAWLTFSNGGTVEVTVSIPNNLDLNANRVVTIDHTISSSGAAEYPTSLALPSVTINVGDTPPPPPVPTCEAHNFDEGGVVRSGIPDAIRYAVNCRVLYQNGSPTSWMGNPLYSEANLGVSGLQAFGVEQTVDIFSPPGLTSFEGGAVFCLRGSGTLIWLAASGAPRVPQIIGSYSVPEFSGFTCATLFEPGTLILVRDNPAK